MHNLSKLGYKLVSEPMLSAVMGKNAPALLRQSYAELDDFDLMLIKQEMQAQGVPDAGPMGYLSSNELEAELAVPTLLGDNIAEHFEAMADEYLAPAVPLIAELLEAQEPILPSSEAMLQAIAEHGADCWHTFGLLGEYERSDYTLPAKAFVADCETFSYNQLDSHFPMPIIFTAISNGASHLWISSDLLAGAERIEQTIAKLPSIGKGKLAVFHNSAFDNTKVQERYNTEQQNYVFCTLAMNQTCAGLDASNRWKAAKFGNASAAGCLNSLVEAYNYHASCAGGGSYEPLSKADKAVRNIFVQCALPEIKEQLGEALQYAALDPLYTLRLFKALWPKYKAIVPSNVPLAAHSITAQTLLQIDSEWHSWLAKCEALVQAEKDSISNSFASIAQQYVAQWRAELIELAKADEE